jgi:HTH-type transcriptional regulator, competence development regulator
MTLNNHTKSFGTLIKERREATGLTIRRVASALDLDAGILQKIEESQRNACETHIKPLAQILKLDEAQLHTVFLAEQILRVIRFDQIGLAALQMVEVEVKTYVHKNAHRSFQLEKMRSVFRNFQRVSKAYITDLSEQANGNSNAAPISIAVELVNPFDTTYSLSDIQRSLKITLNKDVLVRKLEDSNFQQNDSDLLPEMELVYQRI